jgi:hypothetical protein
MDEPRKPSFRWLLGLLVVVAAAGALWAATALAGGGTGAGKAPAAEPAGKAAPAAKAGKARSHDGRDCPGRDGATPSSLDV